VSLWTHRANRITLSPCACPTKATPVSTRDPAPPLPPRHVIQAIPTTPIDTHAHVTDAALVALWLEWMHAHGHTGPYWAGELPDFWKWFAAETRCRQIDTQSLLTLLRKSDGVERIRPRVRQRRLVMYEFDPRFLAVRDLVDDNQLLLPL
jgi:hypothetical protein